MAKPHIDQSANDYDDEVLAAAARNWNHLRPEWCKCGATLEESAYYRDPKSGSHGWMCINCCGIMQTG